MLGSLPDFLQVCDPQARLKSLGRQSYFILVLGIVRGPHTRHVKYDTSDQGQTPTYLSSQACHGLNLPTHSIYDHTCRAGPESLSLLKFTTSDHQATLRRMHLLPGTQQECPDGDHIRQPPRSRHRNCAYQQQFPRNEGENGSVAWTSWV